MMIGQATAALQPIPRRWLQRAWGMPYIPKRQDWAAMWPYLQQLPQEGVRLLDAGCGPGTWTLELAARRPGWSLLGLDMETPRAAQADRERLGLSNVEFAQAGFLDFQPPARFDVVLSIYSAHYLFEADRGVELFQRFRSWLKPGGRLFLLGPRREEEIPFVSWLPRPNLEYVFSLADLSRACEASQLAIEVVHGCVGRLGTMAKQLDCMADGPFRRLLLLSGLYPLQWLLSALDAQVHIRDQRPAFGWLLVARAAA